MRTPPNMNGRPPTRRVVLQPPISISGPQWQDVRFSVHTGGAKEALIWINVFKNSVGTAPNIDIYGASSQTLLDPASGSSSYWLLLRATSVGSGAVGAFNGLATVVPDFVRWRVPTLTTELQFEIVLYLYDS